MAVGGSIPFNYQDFSGGFNSLTAPFLLNDTQARDVSNIQGTLAGAIVKRGGLTTFASPAATLTSLFPFEAVSPVMLVGAGGTALYSVDTGGTVTSIKTGLTSGKRWEFISAPSVAGQGQLYGMNGTDTPQQWSGTGSAADWTATDAGGSVPNGKYCLYHNNQVFVAGVAGSPSTVFWSGLADPTAWNPANINGSGSEQFDPGDGEAITGLGVVGPYVLVCKPRKLWILINPATGQSRQLSDNVGCPAHRSIAVGPEGTYFLAEDRGVYVTNGSALTPLTDQIQPTVDSIVDRTVCSGAYFDAHYYLSCGIGGATADTTLDYDARLKSWWKHAFGSNQFVIWHPTGPSRLYSAKSTAAIVDRCFDPTSFQDNGSNFTWSWKGPWQSPSFYRRRQFPTPYFRKRMRQQRYSGTGNVDLYLAKDFADSESLIRQDLFNYVAALAAGGTFGGGTGTFGGAGTFGGQPAYAKALVGGMGGSGVANAFSIVFKGTNNYQGVVTMHTEMIRDRRDRLVG